MITIAPESVQAISKSYWQYCGWPTLARRQNGELIAVFSGGRTHHRCPVGQIHLIRSSDHGKTWSEPMVIANGPIDDRGAGVIETECGAILVTYFTTAGWLDTLEAIEKGRPTNIPEDDLAAWCVEREKLDMATLADVIGCWAIRSEDDGQTWSEPIRTPVLNAHGPALLDNGDLIYSGKVGLPGEIGLEHSPFPASLPFGVAVSRDDGLSWSYECDILRPPSGKLTEPHVVQAADGRLLMHIRYEIIHTPEERRDNPEKVNADRAKRFVHQTQSFDGGRTWETPVATSILGYPSHLLRLRDGRLVTSYSHRFDPISIQVRVTDNHGESWSTAAVLHHDPKSSTDMGYPSTVQLDDEWLLTMWYERPVDATVAVLKTARWRLDELDNLA